MSDPEEPDTSETPNGPQHSDAPQEDGSAHEGPRWMRFLERGTTVMLLGGLGSLVLSFVTLGFLPLSELSSEVKKDTPSSYRPMNQLEQTGFTVYKKEGCAYCHSNFVRSTTSDVRRFGAPAEAWEYQDQYPQQWGTRRIGPDLSRESGLRTDAWQYAHLYDPRSTVPQSVMPPYPWLFQKKADGELVPTQEARGLVAYLNFLGRAMRDSGPQTKTGSDAVNGVVNHEGH